MAGQAVDAETSSAAAQLVERRNADVITDNMGSQEMRAERRLRRRRGARA